MAGGRMSASDGTPRELLLYRHPNKVLRAAIRRGPELTIEVCALGVAGYVARRRRDGVGRSRVASRRDWDRGSASIRRPDDSGGAPLESKARPLYPRPRRTDASGSAN